MKNKPLECPITDSEWRQWSLELAARNREAAARRAAETNRPIPQDGPDPRD